MAARRPASGTRTRLAKLLGTDRRIDDLVERAKGELVQLRSVRLGATVRDDLQGMVTLLFALAQSRGDPSSPPAANGSALSTARCARPAIPSSSRTPRQSKCCDAGVVTCSSSSGCVVVLDDPVPVAGVE